MPRMQLVSLPEIPVRYSAITIVLEVPSDMSLILVPTLKRNVPASDPASLPIFFELARIKILVDRILILQA